MIEYPLRRLREGLTGHDTYENSKDGYIYVTFLTEQFKELQLMARELDDEYNVD